MTPAPYRVADKRQETHDTWTLTLEPAGEGLPPFSPGQIAMLYAFGVGEVPISVSGDSAATSASSSSMVGMVTHFPRAGRGGRSRGWR